MPRLTTRTIATLQTHFTARATSNATCEPAWSRPFKLNTHPSKHANPVEFSQIQRDRSVLWDQLEKRNREENKWKELMFLHIQRFLVSQPRQERPFLRRLPPLFKALALLIKFTSISARKPFLVLAHLCDYGNLWRLLCCTLHVC